ncbi:hypothetical protein BZA77DRAFT_253896 [Pyronema omphalodes]|nr:hypothetical protein BZA77DRAFT_253896 [Pyronema omphalodes]
MESTYGISKTKTATSIESAGHREKTSRFDRWKEKTSRIFRKPQVVTETNTVAPATNIIPDFTIALPLDKAKEFAHQFDRSVSSCTTLKWALRDKDRLQELITGLERCNQDLIHLTDRYFYSTTSKLLRSAEYASPDLHFLVPFPENEDYVGKSQVRTFVEEKRANQHTVMSHIKVALRGLGGVGKTQDVLDFVYSCKTSQSVFWIYCDSPTRFDEDYRKLAKLVKIPGYNELDPSQDTRLMVKNWLESKDSGDWVLVLDNADNKTDFFPGPTGAESHGLAEYIPKCAKGTIVITTRDYEVAQQLAGSKGVLTKHAMAPSDARILFHHHYPGDIKYSETDCDKLLDELQYLPLAITQVASYLQINRHTITPTQYLADFQRTKARRQQLLSRAVHNPFRPALPASSTRSDETVLTTFEITFRQILTQSPLAGSILRLIACIDAQAIPHELVTELASQSDDTLLSEALSKLVNFSLLKCHTDSKEAGQTTYTIHLLVHLAIQCFMSPEEKVSAIHTTAQVLAKSIPPDGVFENWPRWRRYLPHTTAFLSYVGNALDDINIATICYSMADYLSNTGRYRDSHPLAERATTIRKLLLGHEHRETLKSMLLLADASFHIGMRDKCEEIEVEVVALSEKVLGGDHPDTLKAMRNLASTLSRKGKFDEAETLQRKLLEARKVVLGEDHPDTLTAMSSLASTLRNKGKFDEAEPLDRKVLEASKVVLGEDHPDTLTAMSNLASTLRGKGKFDEAETLQRKLLEASKVVLGEDHPDTLIAMSNLASTLRNKGKFDEAEPLDRKVLEASKVVLGEDHPNTLTAMSNLASTLCSKGKLDEAETLQRKLLEASKVVLGEDHPNTLAATNNLALALTIKGKFDEAETLQRKLLEASKVVLGEDHPDTLTAMNNVASTLLRKGKFDEAQTLQRKLLEARKVVLGEDHPNTLTAMSNLACTLCSKGKLDEAETLQRKLLEASKVVLGEDHPNTLTAMSNLASTLCSKGKLDEAETLQRKLLEASKVVLGEDHPDTLTAMSNLASTLRGKGKFDEAEALQRKVLETRKVVLGEDHPDTLTVMHNLAVTYHSRSSRDLAIEMMEEVVSRRLRIIGSDHDYTRLSMKFLESWKNEREE